MAEHFKAKGYTHIPEESVEVGNRAALDQMDFRSDLKLSHSAS